MKNQANVNDIISIANAVLGMVPKLVSIIGFAMLCLLLWKAVKGRNSLSIMDLSAIVIAFALVGGR